jgi:hypothetical protein
MAIPINTDTLLRLALIFDGKIDVQPVFDDGKGWHITLPNKALLSVQHSARHSSVEKDGEICLVEMYAFWSGPDQTKAAVWTDVHPFATFTDVGKALRQLSGMTFGQRCCHCGEPENDSDHCSECGCEHGEAVC